MGSLPHYPIHVVMLLVSGEVWNCGRIVANEASSEIVCISNRFGRFQR